MTSSVKRPTDEVVVEQKADYRWLYGVWIVVALFGAIAIARSLRLDIPFRDPEGTIFRARMTYSFSLFGLLIVLDAAVRAWCAGGWTVGTTLAVLRTRWLNRRLLVALSGLVAYHLVYVCYRNLKSWDAFNHDRDGFLLDVDKWLFLGHSPAVLLHDLFGQGAAMYVFGAIYGAFTYLVPLSFVAALAFADRIRDGYIGLMAAMWVWILGVGSYYLIPSLGPFASAPQEFARLPRTGVTDTQVEYLTERAHLLANPAAGDAFASISAFASLHVAFTCTIMLMLRYYGFRRAATVMMVYLAGVVLATIYLGWHFVVDDIAGIALAYLAVLLARLMIDPHGLRQGSRRRTISSPVQT